MGPLGDCRATRGRRAGLDLDLVAHVAHAGDLSGDGLGGVLIRLPRDRTGELHHTLLGGHSELRRIDAVVMGERVARRLRPSDRAGKMAHDARSDRTLEHQTGDVRSSG